MPKFRSLFAICTLVTAFLLWPVTTVEAQAQDPSEAQSSATIAEPTPEQRVATWNAVLDNTEQAVDRRGMSDDDLANHSTELKGIALQAATLSANLEPRVAQIKQRIDELGPLPADGEPGESDEISDSRQELNAQFASVDGALKAARLVQVRANQIDQRISDLRRNRFVSSLSEQSVSILDVRAWPEFMKGLSGYTKGLGLLFKDSAKVVIFKLSQNLLLASGLFAGLALTLALYYWIRDWLSRMRLRERSEHWNDRQVKLVRGLLFFIQYGLLRALLLLVVYWFSNQ